LAVNFCLLKAAQVAQVAQASIKKEQVCQ